MYNIAGQTFIVRRRLRSSTSDPAKFADPTPIGTGPYTLAKFTAQGLQFKANPTYWGGTAGPEVDVPGLHQQRRRTAAVVRRQDRLRR